MRRSSWVTALAPLVSTIGLLTLTACGGAGAYGHAAVYAPLPGEEESAKGARDYDPVLAQREAEAWHKGTVSLFGVVISRSPGPAGSAYLTLGVRRLEARNVCEHPADASSCRTTVSDHDYGVVHAVVVLRPEDDVGEHPVGIGSLLRLVGPLAQDPDPTDGRLVVRPTFYRHWPRYFFVSGAPSTSSARP